MKFKIKKRPEKLFENEFLILPRKFNGYIYWLCWATIKYNWIGFRYQRFGEMVSVGKCAKNFRKIIASKPPKWL